MQCLFKGCTKDAFCKGLCGSHYQQKRKGQELKPLQQQFHGYSELERFELRVAMRPDGCWLWLGSVQKIQNRRQKDSYGQWRNGKGQREATHRAAWRLYKGPLPTKACVLHKCDRPRCVNPDHLYLGSQADNVQDMWDRKRAKPQAHYGIDHGMAKLAEDQVIEIRKSREKGTAIAKRFGVSTTTIYDIRNRKSWRHIK